MKIDSGFDVFLAYPGEVRIRIRQSRAISKFIYNLVSTIVAYGLVIAVIVLGDVEWSIGIGVGMAFMLLLPLFLFRPLLQLGRDARQDQVFVFDKKTGSIFHNGKRIAALGELEGLEIETATGEWIPEGAELVHLSLIYGSGQSTSVGSTTAVHQLRKAAAMIAESLNIDVWDEGPREVDPSKSIWYRDLGTGKYDPDVLRRVAPSDIVQRNWVILVVAFLMVLLLFS